MVEVVGNIKMKPGSRKSGEPTVMGDLCMEEMGEISMEIFIYILDITLFLNLYETI